MPSKHQSGGGTSGDYDSDEKRMLAVKNDLTIAALIRGICDPDRAQSYIDAEIELAAEEDRDPRKGVIGACNRKITALEDEDTDANDAGVDAHQTPADDKDADTPTHGPQDGDDSGDTEADTDGDGDGDPYADVPHFDTDADLEDVVADHEHGDVFTTAKPEGTLAGCFKCESHIGFVPKERDGDFDG